MPPNSPEALHYRAPRNLKLIGLIVVALAMAAFSFPIFIIGYAFVWGFALKLRVLPVQGYFEMSRGAWPGSSPRVGEGWQAPRPV